MAYRPGKREREARKCHRRAHEWNSQMGAVSVPLKVGHEHSRRLLHAFICGGQRRNELAKGVEENGRQHQPE